MEKACDLSYVYRDFCLVSEAIFLLRKAEWKKGLQKTLKTSFSTLGGQPLANRDKFVAAWGGGWWQYVCTPTHVEWGTLLGLKAAQAHVPPVLLLYSWNEVIWRGSSGGLGPSTQLYEPLAQAGPGTARRKMYCPCEKRLLSLLVLGLTEWVKNHAGLSLLSKNVCPFCLPLPESWWNRFVISLLPCCALVWEGSQQHRSRLWHMHALLHGQWIPFIKIYFTLSPATSLCPQLYIITAPITTCN